MFNLLLAIIYLAFISLGLPDALLGAAWPTMYLEFGVAVSYAGVVSMIIALGTILSSLQSDRLTKKLGTGRVTALSVLLTAIALYGFSMSDSFWMLCLWAIPYGLGAGSVDASINNFVALNYASSHMSWLHCFWGVGASLGPAILGYVLTNEGTWNNGYFYIAVFQFILTAILFLSLPLWKDKKGEDASDTAPTQNLSLREILALPGAKASMITFLCYCGIEATTGLWASSYLFLYKNIPEDTAATYASLFFIGITVGRAIGGFVTMKFTDDQMIKYGISIILIGVMALLIPLGTTLSVIGFVLIGLGCAPIYPAIIHSTPDYFGADKSQAVIGVQMASAYVGTMLMPPIFGLIANHIHVALLPIFLVLLLGLMYVMHNQKMQFKVKSYSETI
ncbi:MFS transporter [Fundicoccus culcitae]|uniref:MFS transporter n=1 Tax=Fundicoccus culcitae TaxID=2969821 RepID=A0ABY5P7I7_9LACT|nr:MFS transporter [Fundicoccus culcitae]UUX34692.1 MFS transporter [Fundicoccus culcitae]